MKRKKSNSTLLMIAAALFASLAVYLVAFADHWPLVIPLIAVFRLFHIGVSALYFCIPIFAMGYFFVFKLLRVPGNKSPGWTALFSWAFGCGLMILIGLFMLSSGLYHPLLWNVLALAANLSLLLFLFSRRHRLLDLQRRARELSAALKNALHKMTGWDYFIFSLLLLAFLSATIPPNTRDELVYHLALPKLWGFQHDWWMNSDNMTLLFPANMEILWGYAMAVTGLHSPSMLTLIFAGMTIGLMYKIAADSEGARWVPGLSVVFFLATPVMMVMAAINYVEWPLLFFLLLGWRSARQYLAARRFEYAVLTALSWGIVSGGKYSFLVVIALLLLEWGYRVFRAKKGDLRLVLPVFIASFALFSVPWLIRNALATGDPFFPLGQRFLSPTSAGAMAGGQSSAASLTHYENIPGFWRYYPMLYHMTIDRKIDHRLHLGWLFLHLWVLLAGWKFRRFLPWFPVLFLTAFFAFFTPSPRIYAPFLALLWLFLPIALGSLRDAKPLRAVAKGMMAIFALSSFPFGIYFWFMSYNRVCQDYLFGLMNSDSYLKREGLVTPVMHWLHENSGADAKIWLVGGDRIFYFDRWVRPSDSYALPAFLAIARSQGTAGLERNVAKDGIDFIVLDTRNCSLESKRVRTDKLEWRIPDALHDRVVRWMHERLQLAAKDPRYELYLVKKSPAPQLPGGRGLMVE